MSTTKKPTINWAPQRNLDAVKGSTVSLQQGVRRLTSQVEALQDYARDSDFHGILVAASAVNSDLLDIVKHAQTLETLGFVANGVYRYPD